MTTTAPDKISRHKCANEHLATKADVAELKAEMRLQRWLSLAVLAVVIASVVERLLS